MLWTLAHGINQVNGIVGTSISSGIFLRTTMNPIQTGIERAFQGTNGRIDRVIFITKLEISL